VGEGFVFQMTTSNHNDKRKVEHVVELLKFALSLDDEEILRSTVESVIEILSEEIDK
jgi:hypothetical protein